MLVCCNCVFSKRPPKIPSPPQIKQNVLSLEPAHSLQLNLLLRNPDARFLLSLRIIIIFLNLKTKQNKKN